MAGDTEHYSLFQTAQVLGKLLPVPRQGQRACVHLGKTRSIFPMWSATGKWLCYRADLCLGGSEWVACFLTLTKPVCVSAPSPAGAAGVLHPQPLLHHVPVCAGVAHPGAERSPAFLSLLEVGLSGTGPPPSPFHPMTVCPDRSATSLPFISFF